jgi:hypothetical protein
VGPLLEQGGLAEQNVTRAFIRYIYEHSGRAGAEPPLTGTVALTCSTGNGATLLRTYDLATGRWQTLYEDPLPFDPSGLNYSYAEPLGNRNGLIVVTRRTTVDENGASLASFTLQLAIPGSGITTTLLSSSAASWEELPRYRSFRFGHDPQGRYLVLADYNPGRGLSPGRYNFALVDLRGCNGVTCPIEPLPGPITWSPDGAAALVVSDGPQLSEWPWQRPELSVGDAGASDLTPLENASVAVWLDSSHFAYVTAYGAARRSGRARSTGQRRATARAPSGAVAARRPARSADSQRGKSGRSQPGTPPGRFAPIPGQRRLDARGVSRGTGPLPGAARRGAARVA